jgi:hypothetical protein
MPFSTPRVFSLQDLPRQWFSEVVVRPSFGSTDELLSSSAILV